MKENHSFFAPFNPRITWLAQVSSYWYYELSWKGERYEKERVLVKFNM